MSCSDDPAVVTPAAGFDTQTGVGAGSLTSGGPGSIRWRFVDGGANDSVALRIRDASGAILGAAGASGGTGEEDEAVCAHGIEQAGLVADAKP